MINDCLIEGRQFWPRLDETSAKSIAAIRGTAMCDIMVLIVGLSKNQAKNAAWICHVSLRAKIDLLEESISQLGLSTGVKNNKAIRYEEKLTTTSAVTRHFSSKQLP